MRQSGWAHLRGKGLQVKRKRYSRKFQQTAVERMKSSDNIGDLAQELGVTRRCLYKWRAKLDRVEPGEQAPRPSSHESSYRRQVERLKRLLAEKMLEVDFFKGALQKIEARRQRKSSAGETASTTRSGE
jgi:transposase